MIMTISKFYFNQKILRGEMNSYGGKLGGFGGPQRYGGYIGG